MNAVITAAANQARQKPVKLTHNQEVSVIISPCRHSSNFQLGVCVAKMMENDFHGIDMELFCWRTNVLHYMLCCNRLCIRLLVIYIK